MRISVNILLYVLTDSAFPRFSQGFSGESKGHVHNEEIKVLELTDRDAGRKKIHSDAFESDSGIHRIRPWTDGSPAADDIFYVISSSDKERFIEWRKSEENPVSGQNRESSGTAGKRKDNRMHLAVLQSEYTSEELADILTCIRTELIEWELKLVEDILNRRDQNEIFASVNRIIDRDFAVVNLDMQYIFCTDGYAKSRNLLQTKKLPDFLYQDLVTQKRFHKAAGEKKAFYYFTDSVDRMDLCHNIFAGEQYIARIVLSLNHGEMELHKGAVELFEVYAGHIQSMFSHTSVIREKNVREQMQELCRALLRKQKVDLSLLQGVLEDYNWKQGDTFQAILLKFNTEAGWDAQLYMMLPYLCSVLETEFPGSFTMHLDTQILLLLNVSHEQGDFLQKVAYFVRENTCKAGVSPAFNDFAELRGAADAAEAAFQIGMKTRPYLWYYLFDDVRLEYMLRSVKEPLSTSMLIHPALRILKEYDLSHRSELYKTLYIYLKNNLNMTAASEELFIHRTSFCRRINQIRKLTGIKLEDPDTFLTLLLSYRLEEG